MSIHLFLLIFFTVVGGCIGSFLNVLIYRLPAGRSLVRPGSRCPACGGDIAWYDNIPVLAWFWLGGRCRACKARISIQYPLIEAVSALLFGGWFFICYMTELRGDFAPYGFHATAPVFVVYLVMWAGLLATVMIDAKYYVIPLTVTWVIAAVAAAVMPTAVAFNPNAVWSVPRVHTDEAMMAFGGLAGLIVAVVLVRVRLLPRSFDEAPIEHGADEAPDAFLAHPHPRREVLKECLFLVFPVMGAVLGSAVTLDQAVLPGWVHVLAGVVLGYLAGGAVVWATRVLGTLAFGKEAMGLGDVHLLAAIGAVVGWELPIVAFFIAPFFGLAWAVGSAGLSKLRRRQVKIIPYGPHLAAASALVIVFREPILERLEQLLRGQA
jgi:leader peptidase (prepilin peptidase)/N-methyltransferase